MCLVDKSTSLSLCFDYKEHLMDSECSMRCLVLSHTSVNACGAIRSSCVGTVDCGIVSFVKGWFCRRVYFVVGLMRVMKDGRRAPPLIRKRSACFDELFGNNNNNN